MKIPDDQMAVPPRPWGLFDVTGIELEYMIVNKKTLNVLPIADKLLFSLQENPEHKNEAVFPDISWSNELARHVVEFKMTTPYACTNLARAAKDFARHVKDANRKLAAWDACLLPTGMHPWMNPDKETQLWPHGDQEIYAAYNRIFNCKGHGWSNLQSMHINLPFKNDEEFFLLHEAIRLLIPLMPALAASSPFQDGLSTGIKDNRLWQYKDNQKKLASVIGDIIPEQAFSEADYKQKVWDWIESEIRPLDPEEILEPEWVNSRTAIARFDRHAIEIRLLDTQESPLMDLALANFLIEALRKVTVTLKNNPHFKNSIPHSKQGKTVFLKVIATAEGATLSVKNSDEAAILSAWSHLIGEIKTPEITARELWQRLFAEVKDSLPLEFQGALKFILAQGSLANRLKNAYERDPEKNSLHALYGHLAGALDRGEMWKD